MDEEHLEPIQGEAYGIDHVEQRKVDSHEQQSSLLKIRSSSFSDSLDRSDNNIEPDDDGYSSYHLRSISVTRSVCIPDRIRVERSLRLPEYGPKILFFSGGTAIRDLSSCLKDYTHNSIHLITPFDSGGSSAEIRRAFDMLSVGDLRNRLLALAARNKARARNNPRIVQLFSHRLEKSSKEVASEEFWSILVGQHRLCRAVMQPMRKILLNHLRWFAQRMPEDFDLCGASIGNLIITGCFLEHDRDIVSVIYMISKFLGVKGFCRPLTAANLHIRTLYSDGREEVGQHLMNKPKGNPNTGNGMCNQSPKIVDIDLVENLFSEERQASQQCHIDIVSSDLIASADLICFPMGSFFASILVNLLPKGVGRAIVKRKCPKVYIPNTGIDSEMSGYTMLECVQRIIDMVRADHHDDEIGTSRGQNEEIPVSDILNYVLVDTTNFQYFVDIDKAAITELGVEFIDVPLAHSDDCILSDLQSDIIHENQQLHPIKIAEVLISLGS